MLISEIFGFPVASMYAFMPLARSWGFSSRKGAVLRPRLSMAPSILTRIALGFRLFLTYTSLSPQNLKLGGNPGSEKYRGGSRATPEISSLSSP